MDIWYTFLRTNSLALKELLKMMFLFTQGGFLIISLFPGESIMNLYDL